MKYNKEGIEAIAEKLHAMPEVDKKNQELSKKEAVKLLAKEIELLKKRGYTLEKISEILREEGMEISTPSLKKYLQRKKRTKKNTVKNTKKIDTNEKKKTTSIPVVKEKKKRTKSEKKKEILPKPNSNDI